MGPTFRPTPNCTSSDPSQKVLFARPLEYFKSILRPQYEIFSIKIFGPILCMVTNSFRKKSIHFDRIKRPKIDEGSGEQERFERGQIKFNLGSGENYIRPSSSHTITTTRRQEAAPPPQAVVMFTAYCLLKRWYQYY